MSRIKKAFYFIKNGRFGYLFTKLVNFLKLWISANVILLPPTSLMIEPTNMCNLKCPLCPTGLGVLNRVKRSMTIDEFKKIIDQVKGRVKEIVLWHYGEPFVNKKILEMIEYATKRKISIITSTNGHFFTSPEYCEKIVKSGIQRMIVAIDGADQEAYEKFRVGGNFEKVTQGVRWLVAAKKKLKSKTPYIEMQFIVMKHNQHQKQEMKNLATHLEVDYFIEKEVGLHGEDLTFFDMRDQFLPKEQDGRFYLDEKGKPQINGIIPNFCEWPYRYSVINSDGNVVPCSLDMHSKHIMGNVFQEDFFKIWNNKKYQDFRNQLRLNRKDIDMCRVCTNGVCFNKTSKILEPAQSK